jgi:hypothetical protein
VARVVLVVRTKIRSLGGGGAWVAEGLGAWGLGLGAWGLGLGAWGLGLGWRRGLEGEGRHRTRVWKGI